MMQVLRRERRLEERLEGGPVVRLDDDGHLVYPRADRLLHDHLDDRLGQAVAVHQWRQFLLDRLRGREHARAEAGGRNHRLADPPGRRDVERQAGQVQVAGQDLGRPVPGLGVAGQQLGRAVALAPHALTAPDEFLDGPVGEDLVEFGGRQFLRAHRRQVLVEQALGLGHQGTQGPGVAALDGRYGLRHDPLVDGPQVLVDGPVAVARRERVALVQVRQDLAGILGLTEVDDEHVQVAARPDGLDVDQVGVEGHGDRPPSEGAALVHPSAAGGRGQFPVVGDIHLAANRQLQVVQAVERPGRQHADCRRRGQALRHRQVRPVIVNDQALHVMVHEDLVGHARHVGERAAGLRLAEEGLGVHRDLGGPDALRAAQVGGHDEVRRMRTDVGVNALVRPGDDASALFDLGVGPAVAAGPVGVLAEEADAAGNEESHPVPLPGTSRPQPRRPVPRPGATPVVVAERLAVKPKQIICTRPPPAV